MKNYWGFSLIKFFISDIDGTLTDGIVAYSSTGDISVSYSRLDGEGFARLREAGIAPIWVTREKNNLTHKRRAKDLGINYFLEVNDKFKELGEFLKSKNSSWEEAAYIGDDVSDLPSIMFSKYGFIPNNSVLDLLISTTDLSVIKTTLTGGKGCVREAIEYILNV